MRGRMFGSSGASVMSLYSWKRTTAALIWGTACVGSGRSEARCRELMSQRGAAASETTTFSPASLAAVAEKMKRDGRRFWTAQAFWESLARFCKDKPSRFSCLKAGEVPLGRVHIERTAGCYSGGLVRSACVFLFIASPSAKPGSTDL